MTTREWPAWRWAPDGRGKVFQSAAEVPAGWMTKLEYDALPKPEKAAEAVSGAPVAVEPSEADKAASERLRAALLTCGDDILDDIAEEPTPLDAAAAAIGLLVSELAKANQELTAAKTLLDEAGGCETDLSGDGKVEDNRDEIKKALKAKDIPFDGRASTPTLKALLEGVAQ